MSPKAKEKLPGWMEAVDYMTSNNHVNLHALGQYKRSFLDELVTDVPHPLGFDSLSVLAYVESLDSLPDEDIRKFLKEVYKYGL